MNPPIGSTVVTGVIGDPVGHSLSPILHNTAFSALNLPWVYVAFPVAKAFGGSVVESMRTMGIRGLSVTMPHKDAVARDADDATDDVRLLGAANTLVAHGHRIAAHSTDGEGCVGALRAAQFDPEGKRCLVLGAGGAARAVILALARAGAREIFVANRSRERAERAAQLGLGRAHVTSDDVADSCDLIINATPVGMGTDHGLPIDPARLGPGQVVNDLIYHPLVTPLLAVAEERGARTVGGLEMLLHQAGRQFYLWTGEVAPLDQMRQGVTIELERRARQQ